LYRQRILLPGSRTGSGTRYAWGEFNSWRISHFHTSNDVPHELGTKRGNFDVMYKNITLFYFQRGSEEMVLSELNMADELYHYMAGGHKRPLVNIVSIVHCSASLF
jgi:hypothetical protein